MDHFYQKIEGWFDYPALYQRMVNNFQDGAHFVEVGAWVGKSSSFMAVEIANSGKQIKFDVVDTWAGADTHATDPEIVNGTLFDNFLKNIQPVKELLTPIRLASVEAAKLYQDNSLDFVMIDGAHDYENVTADIKAWLPKVKVGGILAGDDYAPWWPGVINAVNDLITPIEVTVDGSIKKVLPKRVSPSWIYKKQQFNNKG